MVAVLLNVIPKKGIIHAIRCRCFLSQLKRLQNAENHRFVVFSRPNDDCSDIESKITQCNNCGIVHRVTGVCQSKIVEREESKAIRRIEDVKASLNANIIAILEAEKCDLEIWEQVEHIVRKELWGEHVVISNERHAGYRSGKYIRILSPELSIVEAYETQDSI